MRIGYDAKRIVSNGTGLGSYGRTLINSLAALEDDDELLLELGKLFEERLSDEYDIEE